MALIDAALVFALSLLVGTVGILAGVRLIVDTDAGILSAGFTALIGALIWALSGVFVGWIPIVGALLMLLAWVAVINWRYPGGWITAASIGFVAWIVAVGIVFGLTQLGIVTPDVLGIPGV